MWKKNPIFTELFTVFVNLSISGSSLIIKWNTVSVEFQENQEPAKDMKW